ncbi:hypothetical protein [Accumulibacter sp.]|uniref:hypothetical protein n=1 Tax=Accumulibacter sp. TaxID=2053492 RepID=UPI0028C38355|nr:hypothetical protein [Accumulibacter sp.]
MKPESRAVDETALLEQMLLVRAHEEAIVAGSAARKAPETCTSVGQEAAGIGVVSALGDDDLILTNRRGAAHRLAHGADPGPACRPTTRRAGEVNWAAGRQEAREPKKAR